MVRSVSDGGQRQEEHFDAVAVCSGLHQNPNVPEYPGLEGFTGEVIHSAAYRGPEDVRGKRVLVVGGGESGADITAEVSLAASETVLSLRRGVAVLPRWRHGHPNDYRTSRIMNSAAHWIFLTRNPSDAWKRRVYLLLFFPLAVVDKLVQGLTTLARDVLPLLHPQRMFGSRAQRGETMTRLRMRRLAQELLDESGGTVDEQFGTKDEEFIRALAEGRCRRVKAVARFEGPRVVLDGGDTFEPDVVIFCTGFVTRVPMLDDALTGERRFLHLINPAVGPSLGFIGMVRPAFGAIPPIAELQARYFALLQSEAVRLPDDDEMRRSMETAAGYRQHVFRAVRGRLDHLVDFTSFCDELAARIGCKPARDDIDQESRAFRLRFYASPFVAAQYRLVGPHAKPSIARQVITSLPISHPYPMVALYYLRWMLSRLLHRLLGAEFAPRLALPRRRLASG